MRQNNVYMKHSLEEMANKVKENSHTVKQKREKMSIERKKKKKRKPGSSI